MNRLDFPNEVGTEVDGFRVPIKEDNRYISFSGKMIAFATSDLAGERNRWTELRIFSTNKGNYVGVSIGCSCLPDETDFVECCLKEKVDDLVDFFTVNNRRTGLSMSLFEQVMGQMDEGVEYV